VDGSLVHQVPHSLASNDHDICHTITRFLSELSQILSGTSAPRLDVCYTESEHCTVMHNSWLFSLLFASHVNI
jgi:hypothetical protein